MKLLRRPLFPREHAVADRILGSLISTRFLAWVICALACFLAGCGAALTRDGSQPLNASISISPSITTLWAGSSQVFVAVVSNAPNNAVTWTVSAVTSATQTQNSNESQGSVSGAVGTIDSSGLYTAPTNLVSSFNVQVTATSTANPSLSASEVVRLTPANIITVSPAAASVETNSDQAFTVSLSNAGLGPVQWLVDNVAGGSTITGTITSEGLYHAPSVDPGNPVTIQAVSSTSSGIVGSATVTILNPPQPTLTGIAFNKLLSSWSDTQLPWIAELSGLEWDADSRTWSPVSGWTVPSTGIGPQVFYLYTALDPITEMAIAKQDVSLMEELALFHVALLNQRTTTIGEMLQSAPAGAQIFIDGSSSDRTFVADTMNTPTQVRITEGQLSDARYLLSAARLLRAVAQLPSVKRTATLTNFVSTFSGFIANEQLIRLLYGSTPWTHWDNPNIPQPLVSGWTYLAATGYEPPHPIKYQAAMIDAELWIMADTAELLGADAAAPDLSILDSGSRAQLQAALAAGTSLLQNRSKHVISSDGADTLSTLAGDYDDHPDFAYDAYDGETVPTTSSTKYGLMLDAMHSSILPPVFQSLYENRGATGANFPAMADVVSLGNTFVHLAYNGDPVFPDFNNFVDGWNGWFRVGYADIPGGYPPHQYCNAQLNPDNCMMAGTLQGWGHLAIYNSDLAALEQTLISLANDDSSATATFKAQHYYYNGPFSANAADYPDIMVYIGGDAAAMVQ